MNILYSYGSLEVRLSKSSLSKLYASLLKLLLLYRSNDLYVDSLDFGGNACQSVAHGGCKEPWCPRTELNDYKSPVFHACQSLLQV